MFRLHIDIPLGFDEAQSSEITKRVMDAISLNRELRQYLKDVGVESVNYRLGNDEDRQRSNYLVKTDNGHVTKKKSRVIIIDSSQEDIEA